MLGGLLTILLVLMNCYLAVLLARQSRLLLLILLLLIAFYFLVQLLALAVLHYRV